jgi:hypothetical protein
MPDHDRHSRSSEVPHDAADLAQVAEAALAPSEIDADESPDDAAGRLRADQLMVEAILEEGLGGPRHVELQDKLIRYAVPVLRRLLGDGQIIVSARSWAARRATRWPGWNSPKPTAKSSLVTW